MPVLSLSNSVNASKPTAEAPMPSLTGQTGPRTLKEISHGHLRISASTAKVIEFGE